MEQEFDTILLLEALDPRSNASHTPYGGAEGSDYLQLDPLLRNPVSFGRSIQRSLNNIGDGFSCEVSDFNSNVVVRVTYTYPPTGRSISKTFLIRFGKKDGSGIVMNTSTKWRTISGIGQAESYIKSVVSSMTNAVQNSL